MIKFGIAVFVLCTARVSAAQSTEMATQPAQTTPKHFRLTFVLTYPQGGQPQQSFVLDVPVTHERSGTSSMSLAAGPTVQLKEVCRKTSSVPTCMIHRQVSQPRWPSACIACRQNRCPIPPLHHQLTFERQVDLALGEPTPITEQMHAIPLRKENKSLPNTPPAAPQITVTAVEM
jgi:hypothetical protein